MDSTEKLPNGILDPTPEIVNEIRQLYVYSFQDPLMNARCFYVGATPYTLPMGKFCIRARLIDSYIKKIQTQNPLFESFFFQKGLQRQILLSLLDDVFEPMYNFLDDIYLNSHEYSHPQKVGNDELDMIWLSLHLYILSTEISKNNVHDYVKQILHNERPLIDSETTDYTRDYYEPYVFFWYMPIFPYIP
jgi:hypothetical protein